MSPPETSRVVVAVTDVFVAFRPPARGGPEPVMALRGADLTLATGERLLVAGPNGSGKSTLLRVVTGDQPVLAGRVEVGGTAVHTMDAAGRRRWRTRAVGFVDQHARRNLLPELDVRDNVALQLRLTGTAARPARARADDTLDRLGLSGLARADVRRLSGGEAQRVALCAAVAHGPSLLLADEPTGELDEEAARSVHALLETVAADGAGIILVSHDPRSAAFVDRAVRLRDGRLEQEWRPGGSGAIAQVADSRGWVRLPTELLRGSGPVASWTAHSRGGGLALDPVGASTEPRLVVPERRPTVARVPPEPIPVGPTQVAVLEDVSAGYGDRLVLDSFHLEVPRGSWTAVRGPSGSGKSTLLSLVTGLIDPSSGSVTVGGTSWAGLDRGARAAHRSTWLAYGLQRPGLVETMTVRENLELVAAVRGRSPTPDEIADLARRLGLTSVLDTPAGVLSGGERQRSALARLLVTQAPMLVLDEPTSQQDSDSTTRVVAALDAATRAGAAVLVASHDDVVLERADHVVVLRTPGLRGGRQAADTISSARARSTG